VSITSISHVDTNVWQRRHDGSK